MDEDIANSRPMKMDDVSGVMILDDDELPRLRERCARLERVAEAARKYPWPQDHPEIEAALNALDADLTDKRT